MENNLIFNFLYIVSLLSLFTQSEDCVNVAIQQNTVASSEIPLYYSHYAVNGRYESFNFCFMSFRKQHPWWRVDLGGTYNIQYIYVVLPSKENPCSDGLTNFTISLGNICEGSLVFSKCYYQEERSPLGSKLNITCSGKSQGQFVKLELGQKDYLVLCEVEVYALEDVIDPQLPCLIKESSSNERSSQLDDDSVGSSDIDSQQISGNAEEEEQISTSEEDTQNQTQTQSNKHHVIDARDSVVEQLSSYTIYTETIIPSGLTSIVASPSDEDEFDSQLQVQQASDASFTYISLHSIEDLFFNQDAATHLQATTESSFELSVTQLSAVSSALNHASDVSIYLAIQTNLDTFSHLAVESSTSDEYVDILLSSTEAPVYTSFDNYNGLTPTLDMYQNTWLIRMSNTGDMFLSTEYYDNSDVTSTTNSGYSDYQTMATTDTETSEAVSEDISEVGKNSYLTISDISIVKTGYYLESSVDTTLDIETPDIDVQSSSFVRVDHTSSHLEYLNEISPVNDVTSDITYNTGMSPRTASMDSFTDASYTTTSSDHVSAIQEIFGDHWNTDKGKGKCWCRCKLDGDTLTAQTDENIKKLTLNPTNLSQQRRKKISIPDQRVSAQSIGYVGIFSLVLVFGPHVLSDVFSMMRYVAVKIRDATHRVNA